MICFFESFAGKSLVFQLIFVKRAGFAMRQDWCKYHRGRMDTSCQRGEREIWQPYFLVVRTCLDLWGMLWSGCVGIFVLRFEFLSGSRLGLKFLTVYLQEETPKDVVRQPSPVPAFSWKTEKKLGNAKTSHN